MPADTTDPRNAGSAHATGATPARPPEPPIRPRDTPADDGTDASDIERAERRSGLRTIRKVAPYLWPEDKAWVKRRVVIALTMLVAAKLVAVATPFFYKAAVDALGGESAGSPAWLLGLGAVGITVAYGVARAANVGSQNVDDSHRPH